MTKTQFEARCLPVFTAAWKVGAKPDSPGLPLNLDVWADGAKGIVPQVFTVSLLPPSEQKQGQKFVDWCIIWFSECHSKMYDPEEGSVFLAHAADWAAEHVGIADWLSFWAVKAGK